MNEAARSSMLALHDDARRRRRMEDENHEHTKLLLESTDALHALLDGSSTFIAIQDSVEQLRESAPDDHDTLIAAFGMIVDEVRFQQPHTIVFSGTDESGYRGSIVAHFSQIVIRVVYVPRTPDVPRREVGFHTIG
jgi:hypothetical protein